MILVTGGTGVMGSILVSHLCEAGHAVRVLVKPQDPCITRVKRPGVELRFADVSHKAALEGVCEGVKTVYHLAAIIVTDDASMFEKINVGGTRNLVDEALRSEVGHIIYVSSASVVYQEPTLYSESKRKCEQIVKESGIPYTIVRPTLVYDKGSGGLEFDMFLSYLLRFPIVPFVGGGNAVKRPVYATDVIKGLLSLNNNPKAYAKTYNFSGGEALSMKDFTRLCLSLSGYPHKPVLPLPVWLCYSLAFVMKYLTSNPPLNRQKIAGIVQDADCDPQQAMDDLGYNPKKVGEYLKECFPRQHD